MYRHGAIRSCRVALRWWAMPTLLLPFALRGGIGYISRMADAVGKLRWFRLTPHQCIVTLLVVEGLLWLSNRLDWPSWHRGYAVLAALAAVAATMLLMLLWFGVALLFHGRFQFGIRSLLVLTVAVALPFGWLSSEMTKAREQKQAVDAIRKPGLRVFYDFQSDAQGCSTARAPSGLRWLHNWLGDDFLSDVVSVQTPTAGVGNILAAFPYSAVKQRTKTFFM